MLSSAVLLFLKASLIEFKRSAILRHRTHQLFRYAIGDVGPDLDGDSDIGTNLAG
jgi:hypothetical protein